MEGIVEMGESRIAATDAVSRRRCLSASISLPLPFASSGERMTEIVFVVVKNGVKMERLESLLAGITPHRTVG